MMAEGRNVQAEINGLEKLPPDVAKGREPWIVKTGEGIRAPRQADQEQDFNEGEVCRARPLRPEH